ncbi:unnamed protein product [Clonostachys byssicola]|uniref:Uncharacterized protein n=1 Tax=Clonostachys byssicola TaxID=160290 RepID=A0A9N9UYQ5_9HYPO|nr:unnamed protein product [Clonostachys byssicola]
MTKLNVQIAVLLARFIGNGIELPADEGCLSIRDVAKSAGSADLVAFQQEAFFEDAPRLSFEHIRHESASRIDARLLFVRIGGFRAGGHGARSIEFADSARLPVDGIFQPRCGGELEAAWGIVESKSERRFPIIGPTA